MYYIQRILKLDYKQLFKTVSKIAKRSCKPFLVILFDVAICAVKYGAGYMDYFQFFFENLNSYQRSTYINRTVSRNYYRALNNREYFHIFQNKHEFLLKFKDFIKRDYVFLNESSYDEFVKFVNKHPVFIAKPDDDSGGKNVEAIDSTNKDLKQLYNLLLKNGQTLLEEKITQCKELSVLYPLAINTIRVVTIYKDGIVHVPFVAIRIGNEGNVVDNFHSGGLFDVVDQDGVIRKPALNKENKIFEIHPYTGTSIIDFKIPMYDEIIDQCKKMAKIVPEIGYVGWDIAVSDKGLDVVEGNQLPGYDIYQSYPHLNSDMCGLKPKFDELIFGKTK